jgi:hypothetical protein
MIRRVGHVGLRIKVCPVNVSIKFYNCVPRGTISVFYIMRLYLSNSYIPSIIQAIMPSLLNSVSFGL